MKDLEIAAGNGLLHRRAFLTGGAALAAAMTGYTLSDSVAAQQLADDAWSTKPGIPIPEYGVPSSFEKPVARILSNPKGEPRTQHARTPHHLLNGTFTPNGLHFVISHSGAPDIDPAKHRLVIHGLVKKPLSFTLDTLGRYPMVSRMTFVECGGNSAAMFSNQPTQASVQAIHGLVSCAEWTGVMLSTLLDEAGIDPKAKWLIAEGGDSLALSRSVPIAKALDDTMVALYQNGERLNPGNGYPMRLLVPGWEGNLNVKWLRRIKLTDQPNMSYYEARTYAPILPRRQGVSVLFPAGSEVVHHASLAGIEAERARLLRSLGRRVFGERPHREGDGQRRRRKDVGAGGAAGAGALESVHAFPRAVEVGRRPGGAAEPRVGRGGQRAADARASRRAARPDEGARHQSRRVPEPALQRTRRAGRSSAAAR